MKLFKEGKVFDLETSQLVGMSTWFTHYDTKRYKYYQSSKGTFFSIEERAETFNNPHCWVINKDGTKSTLGSLQETLSDKDKIKANKKEPATGSSIKKLVILFPSG